MLTDNIASAARRVAEDIRIGRHSLPDDLDAIRPLLDAVAAGPGDEGRVERYARAICRAEGMDPDGCLEGSPDWMYREPEARAAIALADEEAAARAAERWADYQEARNTFSEEVLAVREKRDATDAKRAMRALDAAVRRAAGLPAR